MLTIAIVTCSTLPPSFSAPKLATRQRGVAISKPADVNSTNWDSSRAACDPACHHRPKVRCRISWIQKQAPTPAHTIARDNVITESNRLRFMGAPLVQEHNGASKVHI